MKGYKLHQSFNHLSPQDLPKQKTRFFYPIQLKSHKLCSEDISTMVELILLKECWNSTN